MKKKSIVLILFLCMICLASCHPANTEDITASNPTDETVLLTPTSGFQWDVIDEMAFLIGIGNVTDPDIIIPASVSLAKAGVDWIESIDESSKLYNVVVASDAFYNCSLLRTVTFMDGVSVQNNRMYSSQRGMFAECINLVGVYNIPSDVTDMTGTFANCSSLKEISNFPNSLENLSNCFDSCSSLNAVPSIPDTVRNMRKCFYECSVLVTIPNFSTSIKDLSECFVNCSALVTVPDIPNTVTSMGYTFSGCTSLQEAPLLPSGIEKLNGTFEGCSALRIPPEIPETVLSMFGTFSNCAALETPPEIPSSVEVMVACFENCQSLQYAPIIPDSVQNMQNCFLGCTNMTGDVVVTRNLLEHSGYHGMIEGCSSLDMIYVDTCPFDDSVCFIRNHHSSPVPLSLKIAFLQNHPSGSMCRYCLTQTKYTVVDGIYVSFENIPEMHCDWFVDYLNHQVPDIFKDCVSHILLTDNIDNHLSPYSTGFGLVDGYSAVDEICLEFPNNSVPLSQAKEHSLCYTLYHELSHSLDDRYGLLSQQDEWNTLYEQEGNAASYWYNTYLYQSFDEYTKHLETFAIAAGKYFTDPNALKYSCPGMYEYMDNLFCDAIDSENVA